MTEQMQAAEAVAALAGSTNEPPAKRRRTRRFLGKSRRSAVKSCQRCLDDRVGCYDKAPCRRCKLRDFECSLVCPATDVEEEVEVEEEGKGAAAAAAGEDGPKEAKRKDEAKERKAEPKAEANWPSKPPIVVAPAPDAKPRDCTMLKCSACERMDLICIGGNPCQRCRAWNLGGCESSLWPGGSGTWKLIEDMYACVACGRSRRCMLYQRGQDASVRMCGKCAVIVTRL